MQSTSATTRAYLAALKLFPFAANMKSAVR